MKMVKKMLLVVICDDSHDGAAARDGDGDDGWW